MANFYNDLFLSPAYKTYYTTVYQCPTCKFKLELPSYRPQKAKPTLARRQCASCHDNQCFNFLARYKYEPLYTEEDGLVRFQKTDITE
jgi:hypothetical protein